MGIIVHTVMEIRLARTDENRKLVFILYIKPEKWSENLDPSISDIYSSNGWAINETTANKGSPNHASLVLHKLISSERNNETHNLSAVRIKPYIRFRRRAVFYL